MLIVNLLFVLILPIYSFIITNNFLISLNNSHKNYLEDKNIINNNHNILDEFVFEDITIFKINSKEEYYIYYTCSILQSIVNLEEDYYISVKPIKYKKFKSYYEQLCVPWHLSRINERYKSVKDNYIYFQTGQGITVYVLDSGIDTLHPEFENRASTGYDRFEGQPIEEHGTHVAGIIGSKTYGVAKKVNLVSIRILDYSGSGSYSDIISGLEWLYYNNTDLDNSKIINMSLGGPHSRTLDIVIEKMYNKGYIVVSAAGNENQNACNVSPANSEYSITVGSSNKLDFFSSFSNYGTCVNVIAPGEDILSTIPGNKNTIMSGTSMASPVVAGIISLFLDKHGKYLTNKNILGFLKKIFTRNIIGNLHHNTPNLLAYSFS
jgi:subtilisin family serine protease